MKLLEKILNFVDLDKLRHFAIGAAVGLASFIVFKSVIIVILIAALAGFIKEGYDYIYNLVTKTSTHDVDLKDFGATLLGGVVLASIIAVIKLIITF